MTSSYLFYDLETTGLNKCFDQVIQFAAIRTDRQLQELERQEIYIQRLPDILPAPEAIITHRIGIQKMQQGDSEFEGIKKIHALLNEPGTISVGYNTLGFDDEFLRFSFYRNLLPPYTHQYANQCSRMDIYPITAMYYLFHPASLTWPTHDEHISLKLDAINQANQLATGQAHNAMVDVEVTLELARRLHQNKKMWQYLNAHFDKKTDLQRMNELPFSLKAGDYQLQEAIMVSGSLGHKNNFHAPVIGLGQHQYYKNQSVWLRLDQEDLSRTTLENVADIPQVIRKKHAEHPFLLPPNQRFTRYLTEERRQITDKNRAWLQKHPALLQKIIDYHRHFTYPEIQAADSQAMLYEAGFPSVEEERQYAEFHRATPAKKAAIAEKISDHYRRELAYRLLARHFPEEVSPAAQADYQQYRQQIDSPQPPMDFRGQVQRNRQQVIDSIDALLNDASLDTEQHALIEEYQHYLM